MRTIQVDEAVYEHIRSHAIPYVDRCENDTLARMFGLKVPAKTSGAAGQETQRESLERLLRSEPRLRTKAPKADLRELVRMGLLAEGAILTLVDYSGNRVPECTARVSGGQLVHEGRQYSMSELAQALLKKRGYRSSSVRGPAHWATAEGKTIKELWCAVSEQSHTAG